MTPLPFDMGPIHFVGIGGIGMSGIAEVMTNVGYQVQGSDRAESANVRRLRELGIPVAIGHDPENLGTAKVVVISSAVKSDNPEVVAARTNMLPVVRRSEMLAELMRLKWCVAVAGTHGKTTTTSMVAAILDAADYDPTVINGGIINAYGTNARLGDGEWMVVEADESDGTFIKLPSTIAIVTNMDPEHLDFYGNFETERLAFETFVENVPFYGFAALCIDHPEVQAMIGRISDRRIVTFGTSPQADVRATELRFDEEGANFSVEFADRQDRPVHQLADIRLPMPGAHNVLNALAAITVAHEMGIHGDTMVSALASFGGVKRRFTKTGEVGGITVIDDYGHHPVEIAAVLKAARDAYAGRVIAVVQPHRYSRLQNLFEEFCSSFNDADAVVVAEVYGAGEIPIEKIDENTLITGLIGHGHRNVKALQSADELPGMIADFAQPGDVVICLGAGSITGWANALPEQLACLLEPTRVMTGEEGT